VKCFCLFARANSKVLDVTLGRDPRWRRGFRRGYVAKQGVYPAMVRLRTPDSNKKTLDFKADVRVRCRSRRTPSTRDGMVVSGANTAGRISSMQIRTTLPSMTHCISGDHKGPYGIEPGRPPCGPIVQGK